MADGFLGGAIYDGLHLRVAQGAGSDAVWTFEVKHFTRLRADWAGRITTPPPA